MRLSSRGIAFIKSWEGLRLKAYQDGKGVWTIGYGTTGPGIHRGLVWTKQQAEDAFLHSVLHVEQAVNALVKVAVIQPQFDAMCSLAYNIGTFNFQQSTLLRRVNALDFHSASKEFGKWNHITNPRTGVLEVDKGLTNRRTAETVLFNESPS